MMSLFSIPIYTCLVQLCINSTYHNKIYYLKGADYK